MNNQFRNLLKTHLDEILQKYYVHKSELKELSTVIASVTLDQILNHNEGNFITSEIMKITRKNIHNCDQYLDQINQILDEKTQNRTIYDLVEFFKEIGTVLFNNVLKDDYFHIDEIRVAMIEVIKSNYIHKSELKLKYVSKDNKIKYISEESLLAILNSIKKLNHEYDIDGINSYIKYIENNIDLYKVSLIKKK